ncbi:hypothetical protein RND71_020819 [Anisodus tanguticus]|uniref:PARP1-like PADR1 domain-containing protein n=1 Tax=Anisodus tanguticus TaxID=243964 RepID=A0AAE1RVV5_9SOLA|nr:hypothetical protein RND71_020819 [Anisodus tanguticus]
MNVNADLRLTIVTISLITRLFIAPDAFPGLRLTTSLILPRRPGDDGTGPSAPHHQVESLIPGVSTLRSDRSVKEVLRLSDLSFLYEIVFGSEKVHEKRSHSHASDEEKKVTTRKQKAESAHSPKKAKTEGDDNDQEANGKSNNNDAAAEFEKFCRAMSEHLSIKQMREILEANEREAASISDDAVVPRWFVK